MLASIHLHKNPETGATCASITTARSEEYPNHSQTAYVYDLPSHIIWWIERRLNGDGFDANKAIDTNLRRQASPWEDPSK